MKQCKTITLILGILLTMSSFTAKHEYYVSVGEMSLNPSTKQLEIALRVFTDDLEYALSREGHEGVDVLNDSNASSVVAEYVKDNFLLFDPDMNRVYPFFVGLEGDADGVYLFLETRSKYPIQWNELIIRHEILMDHFPDQINIIHYSDPHEPASYRFDYENPQQEIVL